MVVDVLEYGLVAVGTIDRVGKTGRIHNSQSQFDAALFDLNRWGLDIDSFFQLGTFIHTIKRRRIATIRNVIVTFRVEIGQEETIDERRLAQARLAHDHQSKLEAFFHKLPVHLIGQIRKSNVRLIRIIRLFNKKTFELVIFRYICFSID